jgi:hypothetical protein
MTVPRPRLWFSIGLVALSVLPLLWLGQAWFGPRQGLRFRNVRELAAWAEGHGLHCRSDAQDARVTNGLALSRRPLSWEQVGALRKAGQGQRPEWKGVIWAMNFSPALKALSEPPWDGECRVWGDVLVTGDPVLLDAVEQEGDR